MFKKKRIGLALSGGGARGLAHIGVLKVLERNNIPIDIIAGTSMGAIIGAFYAMNPNAKELNKFAIEKSSEKFFDFTISRYGLVKGKKIEEFLRKKFGNAKFKDMKIPLLISAYDMKKKREVIFWRGDIVKALMATIAIPGLFKPVKNKKEILVDGGVVDPLPVKILENKADIIIGVDVNYVNLKKSIKEKATKKSGEKNLPNIWESIWEAELVRNYRLTQSAIENDGNELIIEVNLSDIKDMNFRKIKKIISRGERAAQNSLKKIKRAKGPFGKFLMEIERLNKKLVKNVKKEID